MSGPKKNRGGQHAKKPQKPKPWVPDGALGTYTVDQISKMSDAKLASIITKCANIDMPNHLADATDPTQEFVFATGLNARPMVVDSNGFKAFMKKNNIPQKDVLTRSVGKGKFRTTSGNKRNLTQQQIAQMWISDPYNYIGGKLGGQVYGAGAYFDMNGGKGATSYGGTQAASYNAVLNPSKAKIITRSNLRSKWRAYAQTHPQTAQAVNKMGWRGDTQSVMALCLGYNVIKSDYGDYHNIITRDAVVVKK